MTSGSEPPLYIDANILIYALESPDELGARARERMARLDRHEISGVTSELTLAEVLPYPIGRGDREQVEAYETLLTKGEGLTVLPVDRATLRLAGELRASHRLHLPDAIHVATALRGGCSAILTNDDRMSVPDALETILLFQGSPTR